MVNFLADLNKEREAQRVGTRQLVQAAQAAKEDTQISAPESEQKIAELSVEMATERNPCAVDDLEHQLGAEQAQLQDLCCAVAKATSDIHEHSALLQMMNAQKMAQANRAYTGFYPRCDINLSLRDLPDCRPTNPASTILLCLTRSCMRA